MTLIRILDRTDPRLGRHVRHDPRSMDYPYRAAPMVLKDVAHVRHIPILDQGQLGSCTGNAAVGALGTGILWDALPGTRGSQLGEDLARSLYSAATKLDDYDGSWPPTDTGSDGLSIAKASQKAGLIGGYRHAFSLTDFLGALQSQPVIVGTVWYESMFDPQAGRVVVDPGSGVAGGHEYVARRFDAQAGLIGFDNSWGPSWGDQGSFWIGVDDFGRLLANDGDATVFTPLPAPQPPADPFDAIVAGLRRTWAAFDAWCRRHGIP